MIRRATGRTFAPHLSSALIACALTASILCGGRVLATYLEERTIHSTAPRDFFIKNQGLAFERAAASVRIALLVAVIGVGIVALPFSIPVLTVDRLVAYSRFLGLTGRGGSPAHLVQPVFAEEFGWDRLAGDVASVYFALPPAERNRTAIYADTYGDAGALDFFGPRHGLPPAISSQNNYYLWGTRGYDGRTLIAIGATRIDRLRAFYRSVTLATTSTEPYKWVVEGPDPIYILRGPIAPLPLIWPSLRWFGT